MLFELCSLRLRLCRIANLLLLKPLIESNANTLAYLRPASVLMRVQPLFELIWYRECYLHTIIIASL